MAVMMGELYAALKEGGASDGAALKAAQEVAGFNDKISDIKSEFNNVRLEFERVKTEFAIVKTMLGIVIAGILALVGKAFLS